MEKLFPDPLRTHRGSFKKGCNIKLFGGLRKGRSSGPGIPAVFPGAVLFGYDHAGASAGNLTAGETTRRLFLTFNDSGLNAGQSAVFMISSGLNDDFNINIVPEPSSGALVGLGVTMLVASRRRLRRRG